MVIVAVCPRRPYQNHGPVRQLSQRWGGVEGCCGHDCRRGPSYTIVDLIKYLEGATAVRLPSNPQIPMIIDHGRGVETKPIRRVCAVERGGRIVVEWVLLEQLDLRIDACDQDLAHQAEKS